MSSLTRRAALGAMLAGVGLHITNTVGFSTVELNRTGDVRTVDDGSSLLKIEVIETSGPSPSPLNPNRVYEIPLRLRVKNLTEQQLTNNSVSSKEGRFRFRQPGDAGQGQKEINPGTLDTLASGESAETEIELLANLSESGKISDVIQFEFAGAGASVVAKRRAKVVTDIAARLLYLPSNDTDLRNFVSSTNTEQVINVEETPRSIGAQSGDLDGDGDVEIPYFKDTENDNAFGRNKKSARGSSGKSAVKLRLKTVAGDETVVGLDDTTPNPPVDPRPRLTKTRLSIGSWPSNPSNNNNDNDNDNDNENSGGRGNGYLRSELQRPVVFYAAKDKNGNSSRIYATDANGNTDEVFKGGNGVLGIAGAKDVDNNGEKELLFVDGSNALRFIRPGDKKATKVSANVSIGSNNSTGFGPPANFGVFDGELSIPIINGSQFPAVITLDGKSKVFKENVNKARKAAVAPMDPDGDGVNELIFLGTDKKIRYVDKMDTSPSEKILNPNPNSKGPKSITVDPKVSVNSLLEFKT